MTDGSLKETFRGSASPCKVMRQGEFREEQNISEESYTKTIVLMTTKIYFKNNPPAMHIHLLF